MRVLKPVYPVLCTFPISLFRPCALLVILNNNHPRLPIFPIIYDERAENSVPPLPLVKSHSAAAVRGCAETTAYAAGEGGITAAAALFKRML